jgi:predicted dehydrogenase
MYAPANRREFLQSASAAVAAASALTGTGVHAEGASQEQIVVGVVGCGGRGTYLAEHFRKTPGVELAYVCDVDEGRRAKAQEKLGLDSGQVVADMRKILDDKRIDAVVVATPDHWHTPAAILACESGKHVYVEKPISHNIREGRLLVETAQRTGRLVQHGTQVRSTKMMIEGVKLLREGIIGDVLVARCWNIQRRRSIGHEQPSAPEPGLDYDSWVGPAPLVPYQSNRCHGGWHWWYHFGTGDMGNDGIHDVEYTRWGLGIDTHPTKIVALGGKFHFDDDQQFPDTQQVTFEYPGNGQPNSKRLLIYEHRLWSTNYPHNCDSGAEFYGTKGQMFLSRRGKIEVRGDRGVPIEIGVTPQPQDAPAHIANFCEAIRGRATLNADASVGHLTASLCHLGNIAARLERSLTFDPRTEQIVGDDEANRLVSREYRQHWSTPRTG